MQEEGNTSLADFGLVRRYLSTEANVSQASGHSAFILRLHFSKCSGNYEILKQQPVSTISCSANIWKTRSLVGKAISLLKDEMNRGNHSSTNTHECSELITHSWDQHETCLESWSPTTSTIPPWGFIGLALRLLMLADEMLNGLSEKIQDKHADTNS